MGEPVRRDNRKALRGDLRQPHGEAYATDVLLIAEPSGDRRSQDADGDQASLPAEPLDMENVVRRLIALLNEQEQ
jgi:hypothetical protein